MLLSIPIYAFTDDGIVNVMMIYMTFFSFTDYGIVRRQIMMLPKLEFFN